MDIQDIHQLMDITIRILFDIRKWVVADIVHGSRVSMVVGQHVARNNLFGPVIDLPGMSIEVLFTSQNGDV
jgi:hypothetical protein